MMPNKEQEVYFALYVKYNIFVTKKIFLLGVNIKFFFCFFFNWHTMSLSGLSLSLIFNEVYMLGD